MRRILTLNNFLGETTTVFPLLSAAYRLWSLQFRCDSNTDCQPYLSVGQGSLILVRVASGEAAIRSGSSALPFCFLPGIGSVAGQVKGTQYTLDTGGAASTIALPVGGLWVAPAATLLFGIDQGNSGVFIYDIAAVIEEETLPPKRV